MFLHGYQMTPTLRIKKEKKDEMWFLVCSWCVWFYDFTSPLLFSKLGEVTRHIADRHKEHCDNAIYSQTCSQKNPSNLPTLPAHLLPLTVRSQQQRTWNVCSVRRTMPRLLVLMRDPSGCFEPLKPHMSICPLSLAEQLGNCTPI